MSLIDKQLRAARLQKEFKIKIQEHAYKSFNGTRQAARNFREGTLNIGQMGFDNTAEERITKEMITDYHKKEQGLSLTSGLASNPANREIASSSGASEHQDIFFFDFFSFFF